MIIADECHRGYTTAELSLWRNTLDHFDAVKIGLTATPAAHTKAYFKDIVYRYSFERAVQEGFLVDYDVIAIKSNVRMNGTFLEEGETVGMIDPESGLEKMDVLEDERVFEASEIEQKVTSPDSNRKIVEEIAKYALEHEQKTGRFPKTLIFASNDLPHTSHADQLVNICQEVFGRGDSFVTKITGRADRPLQRIREFRNRPNPGIAVSVDLMTTGVDIPDLEFIVFLRAVKSRILFEQMMGRGTRKGEKYPDKSRFVVFDCFEGTLLEYFRRSTGITAEPPERPNRTIIEVIEDIWNNRDRDYNTRCLVKRLQRIDKEMTAESRDNFARFISNGDLSGYARELPKRLAQDFTGTMTLLRDDDFQDLLVHYQRPKRVFVVAYETEDQVSSTWLVKGSDGLPVKPEDYLEAFERYVRDNAEKVAAIEILLDRPQEWSTDALTDLRDNLKRTRECFTVESLQKVHEYRYNKALVDIISMVKHAAREEAPLLTAAERVEKALTRVTGGQRFSREQQQWLDRIRQHLIENLTIDTADFDTIPIFEYEGGWARANRAFDGRLQGLLRDINAAMAA